MTPEQSIEAAVRAAIPASGHWPYTRDADVFCGWRPAQDRTASASDRPTRCAVRYDLILCHKRGAEGDAERARFALYGALRAAGWRITDTGPEAYAAQTQMFYWPVTVERGFGLDADGQPYDLRRREVSEA